MVGGKRKWRLDGEMGKKHVLHPSMVGSLEVDKLRRQSSHACEIFSRREKIKKTLYSYLYGDQQYLNSKKKYLAGVDDHLSGRRKKGLILLSMLGEWER